MIVSPLYKQISKKANYYGVSKNYFSFIFIVCAFIMITTKNLGLAVVLFVLLISCGAYLTKKDPDFFDVLLESERFKLFNSIYKTKGKRTWQA